MNNKESSSKVHNIMDTEIAPQAEASSARLSRRGLVAGLAGGLVASSFPMPALAGLFGRGNDRRRLKMINPRNDERIDMIYWSNGRYIRGALHEINHFMRDWRNGQSMEIDRRTIDILSETHKKLDTNEPFQLISGYRSPQTNAMLRRRGSGVAKNSRHLRGEAADITLRSRTVSQMYNAALSCQGGGVGRYSRSQFVHVDCGPVRSWGR